MVIDGREEVREFLEGYFTMMPAIRTEATRFYHADDALIVETRTVGTHEGEIEGIPPNGRPFEVNGIGIFTFDGDKLLGEKVVSDMLGLIRQIQPESASV
jgi:predicted ester cyclase